jgi:hypothetical protein
MLDNTPNVPTVSYEGPLVGWWDAVNYWDDSFWTRSVEVAWQNQKKMEVRQRS